MNKKDIIHGIETCSRLENVWHNGQTPNSTFSPSVVSLKKTLSELLELNLCKCGGDCECQSK